MKERLKAFLYFLMSIFLFPFTFLYLLAYHHFEDKQHFLTTCIGAWDIKFLGNVKKLISINYLIEISFFDMYFIMYSSLSCYFPYIKCH
ncbi:Uncharacterised protein [Staphylococcus aureus]|nr:Uncharacterised protein [Staphylococcus aureus]